MYIDFDIFRPIDLPKIYDLIFVGRLEANKGADLFLDTVKKLNCSAIIVGRGNLEEEIKLKIKNFSEKVPVQSRESLWKLKVDMYGWAKDQSEIARLINRSKILVMSSYNEGGPRVVLESMACGVPVLATNVGLIPDFADKNAIGIINWDADDIANKARELLENEEERKRLSIAGIEIARQFEKKEMIKNYAEKLKNLALKLEQ